MLAADPNSDRLSYWLQRLYRASVDRWGKKLYDAAMLAMRKTHCSSGHPDLGTVSGLLRACGQLNHQLDFPRFRRHSEAAV